ncbi:hypothetical protein [Streptomyces sp. BPTC-684]|uniref:hypothetical protein n=1 Tax=Streptomyces sp. BPTC-684 TaxID=3043734 RepID=UPI0024B05051|nr:hypothetical protein [Streptomyces sp. BPTC-684]WHM40535.1 hypothetical protein QIY60_29155 [Streptomyces sp. BPTC-684]
MHAWHTATRAVRQDLGRVNQQVGQRIGAQAQAGADRLIRRNAGATAIGAIAVLLSVTVSAVIGRHLATRLVRLRDSARDLAHDRLPDVLQRLRGGEEVDVAEAAPLLRAGRDEISEVGRALHPAAPRCLPAADVAPGGRGRI